MTKKITVTGRIARFKFIFGNALLRDISSYILGKPMIL